MAYNKILIENVKKLRASGKTYSEVINKLRIKIPKSTLSNWCMDVPLPDWYQAKIDELNKANINKALRIASVSNRLKREKYLSNLYNKNKDLFKKFNNKALKIALSFLYLGEGSKWHSHRGLTLGSSSEEIISLYVKLLNICYNLEPKNLKCRVSYRADQNIVQLERYWSKITGIPLKNFYKTIPDPRTVGKVTRKKEYKGVCVVMTGHTEIQLELEMIPKIILEGL